MNSQELQQKAIEAGLGKGEGLDANWSVRVWYILGDNSSNDLAESVWLVDDEDDTSSIVLRTLGIDGEDNKYHTLCTSETAEDIVNLAMLIKSRSLISIENDTPTLVYEFLMANSDQDVEPLAWGDLHELANVKVGDTFTVGVCEIKRLS